MKRTLAILLLLALLLASACPVLADEDGQTPEDPPVEEPEPEPVPDPEPTPTASPVLSIDTEHVYPGMNRAFRDGYTPTVEYGEVTIVLPLLLEGCVKGDVLDCSLELGQTVDSPFVYANYKKEVPLTEEKIGEDETIPVFLVTFTVPLSWSRYNGVYPVTVTAKGRTESGYEVAQTVTLYVTITDGRSRDAVQTTAPQSAPKVILSKTSTIPESITAGSEFTAVLTLFNTSEDTDVYNMTATVNASSDELTLLGESNVFYIPKLAAGATETLTLRYACGRSMPKGKYRLNVDMTYENSSAVSYSASGTAVFSITQPIEVSLSASRFPTTVTAGETTALTMQVLNLGRGTVYNVRCEVSGFGLIPSGVGFIGTMSGGSEGSMRVNIFAGAKTMSESYVGEEMYGNTTGMIRLLYEDEDGNEYTQEEYFYTTILAPVIREESAVQQAQAQEVQQSKNQWIITAAILGGLIVLGGGAALLFRKRRKS